MRTATGVDLPANHQTEFYYGNGILWEYWLNIGSGNAVADLTNNPNYPYNPSGHEYRTLFESRSNWADAYGGRMRGYITPTTTGDYWFWIASDDNGELWLSTDSNPDNKTRIAYVPGWTSPREWDQVRPAEVGPGPPGGRHALLRRSPDEGRGRAATTWRSRGSATEPTSTGCRSPTAS